MRTQQFYPYLKKVIPYLLKWTLLSLLVGSLVGSASAFFLVALSWATEFREMNVWVIVCLPLGGLLIGYMYYWLGKGVEKGNNLVLEEYSHNQNKIPFKMAPLVLFGTIATHFFGASAGREGTAIQIGASIADQFKYRFKLNNADRKILLIMGISAGFASVFGTPLAGFIFSLEVIKTKKMNYKAIFPSLTIALIAEWICTNFWGVPHTHYYITEIASYSLENLSWTILAGVAFGLTAMSFSLLKAYFKKLFGKIKFPPLRPFVGGIGIAVFVFLIGSTKYIGLGIPIIEASFTNQMLPYDFAIKVILTAFTLGTGFKGGEVTPLFFMGATLGSALFLILPLPMSLLAGMGFLAVFAGATNTPLACIVMGMELFGVEGFVYIAVACVVAYFASGLTSVYSSQEKSKLKHWLYAFLKVNKLFVFK